MQRIIKDGNVDMGKLPPPLVTVVIPLHNYEHYALDAIRSVQAQKLNNFECFIVNDCSTDNSESIAREATKGDLRFHVLNVTNGNLSATRNSGIGAGSAPFVCCLDADDRMGREDFLEILATALEQDPTIGIAYTGITVMDAEGNLGHLNAWPKEYDVEKQIRRQNQIPSLCMFRRVAWERAGGFRPHFRYAEDAEFWLTCVGLGFKAAQITREGLFHYRIHNKSASRVHRTGEVPEPDWTEFHPWTKDGLRPLAADGQPPRTSWPVRYYHQPDVSIIIPVGPGHEEAVKNALHSVEGQTHRFWECVVVNATGKRLDLMGFPWARVIDAPRRGAGAARNAGARATHAPFLTFLDADDLLKPHFLEATLKAYRQNGRYVYTDWLTDDGRGHVKVYPTPEYTVDSYRERLSLHPVTALIPRRWFEAVGGFDEKLTTYEDVDLFLKLFLNDFCGVRLAEPLLIYNLETGERRKDGEQRQTELKALLIERYREKMEGKTMCNCVEPPKGKGAVAPTPENVGDYKDTYGEMVKVQYTYAFAPESPVTLRGPATRVNYGYRAKGDIFYIWQVDFEHGAEMFTRMEAFEPMQAETVVPPAPEPVSAAAAEADFDGLDAHINPGDRMPVVDNEINPIHAADVVQRVEELRAIESADLESMTIPALKQHAADHNIDISGARSKTAIIERIQQHNAKV